MAFCKSQMLDFWGYEQSSVSADNNLLTGKPRVLKDIVTPKLGLCKDQPGTPGLTVRVPGLYPVRGGYSLILGYSVGIPWTNFESCRGVR